MSQLILSTIVELLRVVHHQLLCQSLFDNILEDRDHHVHHFCRDFDVKFKTCGARNCSSFHCLRVNSLVIWNSRQVSNKTFLVVYIFYVYVDTLHTKKLPL